MGEVFYENGTIDTRVKLNMIGQKEKELCYYKDDGTHLEGEWVNKFKKRLNFTYQRTYQQMQLQ